jgi:hypothetical protein
MVEILMFTQQQNKSSRNTLLAIAASGLLALMLTSTTLRAHQDHGVVAPLVAGFALGALVNYGHSSHHYYQYQRHGHYRQGSGHGSGYKSGRKSGHGYRSQQSSGHYSEGHSSHGRYSHKRSYSSGRGGHYNSRRKH